MNWKNILAIIIAIIIVVLVGCWFSATREAVSPEGEIQPEEELQPEESQIIETQKGDKFLIVLASNPTTGFQWQVDFDFDLLDLVEQKYVPDSDDPMLVGGGGTDTFEFQALKSGTTEITFSYLRPWEGEESIIEEKVFEIDIE